MNDLSNQTEDFSDIRDAVRSLCQGYPGEYWREKDRKREYPTEFVQALTDSGFLAVLIPEIYGGSELGIQEAAAILEEIHKSGCNGAACHAQMYIMGTLLRHGSEEQKILSSVPEYRHAAKFPRRMLCNFEHFVVRLSSSIDLANCLQPDWAG